MSLRDAAKKEQEEEDDRLRTLDVFAGCGGLSEGLHQSGQHSNLLLNSICLALSLFVVVCMLNFLVFSTPVSST